MQRTWVIWAVTLALLSGCAAPMAPEQEPGDEALVDAPEPTAEPFEHVTAEELLPHGLHFVIPGHQQAFIVLASDPAERSASGPVEWVSDPESAEVHSFRAAQGDEHVEDVEGWAEVRADRFVLFGHAGELCRVEADELGELRRASFEASYAWREQGATAPSNLEQAWELGESAALWVARVGALPEACTGAVWASTERSGAPRVFGSDPSSDPALAARALASFRELPEYLAIQSEYSEPDPDSELPPRPRGPWDDYDGALPMTQQLREVATGRRLVRVSATAGSGCGDFGASLWALFEPSAGRLLLRAVERDATPPTDVVDADGDGHFELFSGEHASFVLDGERVHVDISVPFAGCGC